MTKMKVLHIVRAINDARALETAAEQASQGHRVTVLLLHDAVLGAAPKSVTAIACEDDVLARGGRSRFSTAGYDAIVRMIFEHDKVVAW